MVDQYKTINISTFLPTCSLSFSCSLEPRLRAPTQQEVNDFGQNVHLNITIEDNFASHQRMFGGGYHTLTFSLTNVGRRELPVRRWQMYGYFFRLAEPQAYPYSDGFYIWSCGLRMFHVNGYLYRFTPVAGVFPGLTPGSSVTCRIKLEGFQVSRTDSFPRWFVTGSNLSPRIIKNTDDESLAFVSEFLHERQYKRRSDDNFRPYTALDRFAQYTGQMGSLDHINVLPTPLEMTKDAKYSMIFQSEDYVIVKNDFFKDEIKQFAGTTCTHYLEQRFVP